MYALLDITDINEYRAFGSDKSSTTESYIGTPVMYIEINTPTIGLRNGCI